MTFREDKNFWEEEEEEEEEDKLFYWMTKPSPHFREEESWGRKRERERRILTQFDNVKTTFSGMQNRGGGKKKRKFLCCFYFFPHFFTCLLPVAKSDRSWNAKLLFLL